MKKLILSLMVASTVSPFAQTLEERVEALEYNSYEQFFKVSGSLEYRYDKVEDDNKRAWSTADSGQSNFPAIAQPVKKDDSSRNRLFFNLDLESKPTDRLSFYGRLVMRKYFNVANYSGSRPIDGTGFADLIGPGGAADDQLWVERAFFNYQLFDKFTLTVGRLPTLHGPPKHISRDEPIGGEYTVSIFSGAFDGLAGTYAFNDAHKLKFVYTPFSNINYNDTEQNKQFTNMSLIYQFDKKVNFARNLYIQLAQLYIHELAFSTVKVDVSKQVLYAEAQGIADTKLDAALHFARTSTNSHGSITGVGGWYASAAEVAASANGEVEKDGVIYGAILKYGFLPRLKAGIEYFHGDDDAFLYDAVPLDAANIYSTRGDAYRLFVNHDLSSNVKLTVGYISQKSEASYYLYGQIGGKQDLDRTVSNYYLSLVANF